MNPVFIAFLKLTAWLLHIASGEEYENFGYILIKRYAKEYKLNSSI